MFSMSLLGSRSRVMTYLVGLSRKGLAWFLNSVINPSFLDDVNGERVFFLQKRHMIMGKSRT